MAGSRKAMLYSDDLGVKYIVQVDESNGELTGFSDVTALEATNPSLPSGLKMRTVTAMEPATGARRVLPVGSLAQFQMLTNTASLLLTLLDPGGLAAALTSFAVMATKGEERKRYSPGDTGLDDGDVT